MMKIADWMTTHVQVVHPRDSLADAEAKMAEGRFRRLPVVDDGGALIGILTDRNLREHKGYLATTRVTAAMVENAITIDPDESIERAAELLLAHKIGGLPVVKNGALVGIITESDLLAGLLRQLRASQGGH
jgi:CBS domain-containing protein